MPQRSQKKILFLDRDGTLILDRDYLNDPQQVEYLPGVFQGLRLLRDAGFHFLIVTNQSGLARRRVDYDQMLAIHHRIRFDLAREGIDLGSVYYCPHLPNSQHPLRKPQPGMIELGLKEHSGDRQSSWMMGDRWSDMEAGFRAGLHLALIRQDPRFLAESHPACELESSSFLELCRGIAARS